MFSTKFLVVVAAAFAAVASAAECPGSELGKLAVLAADPNVSACSAESGFALIPPSGLPNDAQKTKMCKSTACQGLIKTIKGLNPADCDLTVMGVTLNVGKLVGSFDSDCQKLLNPTTPAPGPVTPVTPGPSTPGPSTPGQTPVPTTVKPQC